MSRFLVAATLWLLLAPTASAWNWPVQGDVLRGFNVHSSPYTAGQHRGIDLAAAPGEPVHAPAAGSVTFAGTVPHGGRTLAIRTTDGHTVTLQHLGAFEVARGALVAEGDVIAAAGSSGDAEHAVPSLHLGIRRTADEHGYVDPLELLPARAPLPVSGGAAAEPPPSPVAAPASAPQTAPAPPPAAPEPPAAVVADAPAEPAPAESSPTAEPAGAPAVPVAVPAAVAPTRTEPVRPRSAELEPTDGAGRRRAAKATVAAAPEPAVRTPRRFRTPAPRSGGARTVPPESRSDDRRVRRPAPHVTATGVQEAGPIRAPQAVDRSGETSRSSSGRSPAGLLVLLGCAGVVLAAAAWRVLRRPAPSLESRRVVRVPKQVCPLGRRETGRQWCTHPAGESRTSQGRTGARCTCSAVRVAPWRSRSRPLPRRRATVLT